MSGDRVTKTPPDFLETSWVRLRDLTRSRHRTHRMRRLPGCLQRNDFGHLLNETPHQNGSPGFADILRPCRAGGFEFGNRNLFHLRPSRVTTAQGPPAATRHCWQTAEGGGVLTDRRPWPKTTTLVEPGHRSAANRGFSSPPDLQYLADNKAVV